MAYVTGSALTLQEFITAVKNAAVAQGWSVQKNLEINAEVWLCLKSPAGSYFHLVLKTTALGGVSYDGSQPPLLMLNCSPSFSDGATVAGAFAQSAQANTGSVNAACAASEVRAPIQKFHIFARPNYIYCAINVFGNDFRHLVFGHGDKFGAYTGGEFLGATYVAGSNSYPRALFEYTYQGTNSNSFCYARAEADGTIWRKNAESNATHLRSSFDRNGRGHYLTGLNGESALMPYIIEISRTNKKYSPVMTIPDIAIVEGRNFTAENEVTYGSDRWVLFPAISKNATTQALNSGNRFIAYRIAT